MRSRTRNVSVALAGAVVLASGAYAIGSQSGSGTSGAATATTERFRPGGPMGGPFGPDLSALADRLGVSTTKLRGALDAIRSESKPPAGDPRADLVKALADGLNLTEAQVTDGLDKLRTQHEDAFAANLAKELGIDADKVRAALDKVRPARPLPGPPPDGPPPGGPPPGGAFRGGPPPGGPPPDGFRGRRHLGLRFGPGAFLGDLAKQLGVKRSDLSAALEKLRPRGPMGGPERGGPDAGGFADDLAKALHADPAKVRSILEDLRSQMESKMQARRDQFASSLAGKLGLSVQKVKDALDSVPHHWGRGP